MIEAYARGVRVLASDLGGMAEVIADGVPGATFAVGDADDLARALTDEIARGHVPQDQRPSPSEAFPEWETVAASLERHSREITGRADGFHSRDELT